MIRTITKYSSLPLLLLLAFTFTSCLDSTNSTEPLDNLLDTAKEVTQGQGGDKVLTNFVELLEETDSTIAKKERITAIIPINGDSVFTDTVQGKLNSLSKSEVNQVIRYHFVDNIVNLNALNPGSMEEVESLQGETLYFSVVSDMQGRNSVHVNGGELIGRIDARNGIIYVVDKVLFQDRYLEVAGLIEKYPQLQALSEAINEADLDEALSNPDDELTVFAPTNEAVENAGGVKELTAEKIKYHVIPKKLFNRDLDSGTYTTMSGQELTIEVDGGTVTINGNATIETTDIEGTNGVVHTIDAVLEAPSE